MDKKIKISYDPQATSKGCGIRIHGELSVFLKLLMLMIKRKIPFPLTSHHGTYFFLEDYNMAFKIATNGTANCILFILQTNDWETYITEHGYSNRRECQIPLTTKKGFKDMLNRVGYRVMQSWNDEIASPSVSVFCNTQMDFQSVSESSDIFKNWLQELHSMSEVLETVN